MKWELQEDYMPILQQWQQKLDNRLSLRQLQIMYLISHGLRGKDIAYACKIQHKTVKNHCTQIYQALGISNMKELLIFTFTQLVLSDKD